MKKLSVLLTMLMTLSVTNSAMAHVEHDEAPPSPFSLKLVNKKDGATIYVTNGGDKVATTGATGKLVLVRGKAKSEVALRSVGENAMETSSLAKMVSGTHARATIKFANQKTATENFIVK